MIEPDGAADPPALVDGDAFAAAWERLDEAHAVAMAREAYGLAAATATRLDTERDDTFLITSGGTCHVLKVAHPADDPAVVELQSAALAHLAQADPGLPVPRVVPALDGSPAPVVAGVAGEPRIARLLTYLPGGRLDYDATTPGQRERIGAAAARLSLALSGFDHPAASRELAWDLQRFGTLRPLLGHAPAGRPRQLVAAELDRFDAGVGAALAATRQQVVHQDLNADNLLVDAAAEQFVVGILDFGDIVRSSIAGDLAVVMAYAVGAGGALDRPDADPWAAPYDLAGGYRAVRPLAADEWALLPDLVRTRLAQRLLLNSWLAACDPANAAYTLRSVDRAARSLARLVDSQPPAP